MKLAGQSHTTPALEDLRSQSSDVRVIGDLARQKKKVGFWATRKVSKRVWVTFYTKRKKSKRK